VRYDALLDLVAEAIVRELAEQVPPEAKAPTQPGDTAATTKEVTA
jgi:hypothetical protein